MGLTKKPATIKLLLLIAGLLGFNLRAALYATGMDEKGLLVRGHWAGICVWLLTAAVAVMIFLLTRRLSGHKTYKRDFPKSISRGVGCILAAAAFLLTSGSASAGDPLSTMQNVLHFAAAAALAAIGCCRFTGRKPFFLLHGVVCLYLALRMVFQYRLWSADPQLQDYCFYLGAHLSLMLTSYQFAACDADMGSHRKLWAFGLASVFLCLTALPCSGEPFFLLGCAIWVYTNLSHPRFRQPQVPAAATREEA